MRTRGALVVFLLLAIGASGCIEVEDQAPDDEPFSARKNIEIFDDWIETKGEKYYATGDRDERPIDVDVRWTMHVTNRGDREHAVTVVVDANNGTEPFFDRVLQPSEEAEFSFPYRGNFILYDRLNSTRDSGLFVKYRVDYIGVPG